MGHRQLWCERGIVVSVEGPHGKQSHAIDKPYALIGTHPAADVALDDPRVSLRDVYLHATEAGVHSITLTALRAATKTTVGWLDADQVFRLGDHRLTARLAVEHPPAARPPLPLTARSLVYGSAPLVSIAFDGHEVQRRPLRRRLTIVGRTQPSALRIKSSDLSTAHLALYWDRGVLWAIDLKSRVGTWINGAAIGAIALSPGAALQIGEVELTFLGMADSDKQAWSTEIHPAAHAVEETEQEEPPSRSDDAILVPLEATDADDGAMQVEPETVVEPPDAAQQHRVEFESLRQKLAQEQQTWLEQQQGLEQAWQAKADDLLSRQAALAAEEAKHRQRFHEAESLRAELTAQREQLAQDAAALEAERAALADDRAALESDRAALEADRAALAAQAEESAQARAQDDARRRELELAQRELTEERRELDLQHKDIEQRQANLRQVEAQIAADRAAGESQLRQQIAALQALRCDLEAAQASLRQQQEAWSQRQRELWLRLDQRTAELARQHAALSVGDGAHVASENTSPAADAPPVLNEPGRSSTSHPLQNGGKGA